jgi:hypothetical protein
MTKNRFIRLLWASFPLLLAVGLYGYAVYLPFFLDDGLLFAIITRPPDSPLSWEIWGGSMTFAYYRPLVFSIWELNQSLVGGGKFDPLALHWLNVMLYGMTGVLLGTFIRRVSRILALPHGYFLGGLAGTIYVLFPFNYNAVIWVASMFHIMAGFGAVLELWCVARVLNIISPIIPADGIYAVPTPHQMEKGGGEKHLIWLIGAWIGVFIATFSHENGVLLAPLIGLLIIGMVGIRRAIVSPRIWVLYIPIVVIIGVYWFLLNSVPRGASPLTILWDDIANSSALFLQTLIYPIVGAYRKLTLADENLAVLWILGGVTITITLIFTTWQSRKLGKMALYGLVWFAIASVPTALFLSTDYVRGSWRLMLFGAIGAGIFWSAVIMALWGSGRFGRVVLAIFVGWSAFMSVNFLYQRQHEAVLQADYNHALQGLIQTHTQGKPLVINAPSFLASTADLQWLPTRETGVMFHAEYVNHAQVFRAQTGFDFPRIETLIDYDIFTVAPNQNFAPFTTRYDLSELDAVRDATDIYVTVWEGERFRPMFVGGMGIVGSDEPIAIFPDINMALTEATATRTAPTLVQFRTRWRVDVPPTARVFLVLDVFCDGEIVGQSIGTAWGGMYPFNLWTAGEIHTDFRDVRLLRDVPDACLSLQVSLINLDGDGNPYAVQSPDGEPMQTAHGENRVRVELVK